MNHSQGLCYTAAMKNLTKIRKLQIRDIRNASLLIVKTFGKFNGSDYFEEEGVQRALDYYDPNKNRSDSEDMSAFPVLFSFFLYLALTSLRSLRSLRLSNHFFR